MSFSDDPVARMIARRAARETKQAAQDSTQEWQYDALYAVLDTLMSDLALRLGYSFIEMVSGRLYRLDALPIRVSRAAQGSTVVPDPSRPVQVAWTHRLELVALHRDTLRSDRPWTIFRNLGVLQTFDPSSLDEAIAGLEGCIVDADIVATYQDHVLAYS